jgi:hypothetical protein
MGKLKNTTMPLLIAMAVLSALLIGGCRQSAMFNPLPYVPPEYYGCAPIEPDALLKEYFGDHAEFRWLNVNAQYNDVVFIFKNILVDERMITGLDRGFIWVDQIQCYLINLNSMYDFKPGDKIDVVGRNAGPASQYIRGLTFNNCVVIRAGQIAIPADSDASSTFTPSY